VGRLLPGRRVRRVAVRLHRVLLSPTLHPRLSSVYSDIRTLAISFNPPDRYLHCRAVLAPVQSPQRDFIRSPNIFVCLLLLVTSCHGLFGLWVLFRRVFFFPWHARHPDHVVQSPGGRPHIASVAYFACRQTVVDATVRKTVSLTSDALPSQKKSLFRWTKPFVMRQGGFNWKGSSREGHGNKQTGNDAHVSHSVFFDR